MASIPGMRLPVVEPSYGIARTRARHEVLLSAVLVFLNHALVTDREAVSRLVAHREPCNRDLANHPTIQVSQQHTVGLLGILNGLLGVREDGYGYVAACLRSEDDSTILEFVRTPKHMGGGTL